MKMFTLNQIKQALKKEEEARRSLYFKSKEKGYDAIASNFMSEALLLRDLRKDAENIFSEGATEGGDKDGQ